jgi:hypothetical protein
MRAEYKQLTVITGVAIAIVLAGCNQTKETSSSQTTFSSSMPVIKHSDYIMNDGFYALLYKNGNKYELVSITETRPKISSYKGYEVLIVSYDLRFIGPSFDLRNYKNDSKLNSYDRGRDYYNCFGGLGNTAVDSNYNPCDCNGLIISEGKIAYN